MTTQSDSYFREIIENLGFVLISVDLDLRIVSWNAQAAQHFGKSLAAMEGRCLLEIFQEQQREDARRLLEETVASKVAKEMELKYEQKDGDRRTFVLIASPVLDAGGRCIGASIGMRDISIRKRLSKELGKSRRMAALGNMAAGVAHHFNNILGGMLTSIDYVLPSDSPRELRRTLRLLAQAIGRATRITKQLEAFAECEHEEAEREELNVLIDRFIERIRPQADRAKINLEIEIEEVASGLFEAQRLMPVLESLVRNAFDAMSAEGTLTIGLRTDNDTALILLSDTGCGIPGDVLDRVFEPFFTTKGELAGGPGGNVGLGLAVVHGLVAELGGTIHLASRIGQGTRVEIRLPLAPGVAGRDTGGGGPTEGDAASETDAGASN